MAGWGVPGKEGLAQLMLKIASKPCNRLLSHKSSQAAHKQTRSTSSTVLFVTDFLSPLKLVVETWSQLGDTPPWCFL